MRLFKSMFVLATLILCAGCASAPLAPPSYDLAEVGGECSLKPVTHSEPGKGPVQITRDESETDHEHYLVGLYDVTYQREGSYGGPSTYTEAETVVLAPGEEFAAFRKPGAIGAAQRGKCSRHIPLPVAGR
jgi:hypothetical protein